MEKDNNLSIKVKNANKQKIDYEFNYYKVRNNAWDFLIKNQVKKYPLDIGEILKRNNWYICTYDTYCNFKNISQKKLKRKNKDGFTILDKNNNYLICFNQDNNKERNRFTICHEIGHIVLEHMYKGKKLEKEANMFAARILMPMLLIKELNITNSKELAKLCDVSIESATFRLKRFNEIKKREKFYSDPKETKLLEQLKPFIKEKLKCRTQ